MQGGSGPFLSKAQSCTPFVTNRGQSLSIQEGKRQLEPVSLRPGSKVQVTGNIVQGGFRYSFFFLSLNQMCKCLQSPALVGRCDLLFVQAVALSSQH